MSCNDSDIIYYNINMEAFPSEKFTNIQSTYDETRSQNIINCADEYYMAIARFSIDASSIPLFVCPVIPNPADPNDVNYTPFTVTITYTDGAGAVSTFTEHIRYRPSSNDLLPRPPTVTSGQDITSTYYYVFQYSVFLDMINTAIESIYAQLVVAFPGFIGVPEIYTMYTRENHSVSIVVPNIDSPIAPGTNLYTTAYSSALGFKYIPEPPGSIATLEKIQFFLNPQLFKYFEGIPIYANLNGGALGAMVLVTDDKNNYYYPPINAPNLPAVQTPVNFSTAGVTYTTQPQWFIFTQQYNAISQWNSLRSIIFLTSSIPVQYEGVDANTFSPVDSFITQGASLYKPIITDFIPDLTQASDTRINFTYNANPYRLIQLNSNIGINRIDLQIFWQDKNLRLYPLFTAFGNSVKLVFIKKSLIKAGSGFNPQYNF
jgi:hypothetical protein